MDAGFVVVMAVLGALLQRFVSPSTAVFSVALLSLAYSFLFPDSSAAPFLKPLSAAGLVVVAFVSALSRYGPLALIFLLLPLAAVGKMLAHGHFKLAALRNERQ